LPLTPAQAALAAVSFDGAPVPADYADLFGGYEGTMPNDASSTIVWVCGRASGKTLLGAAAVLWRCLTADLSKLGKGETAYGICVAPDMKLAGLTLANINGWIESSALAKLVISHTTDSVTLKRPDGRKVTIAVFAAGRGGSQVRGKTILAACLDESCFFRDQSAVVNDADIYNAIIPRVTKGGFILLASTPWVQAGLVHSLYSEQFGKPVSAIVALAKTSRMRTDDPDLLRRIEVERQRDPDNAAREFDCHWLARGSGNAFDVESLNAAVTDSPAQHTGRVFVGGDIGLVQDPSAFVAVAAAPNRKIIVLDTLEMKPGRGVPLSLTSVLTNAQDFALRWSTSDISVDHHSLPAALEMIQQQALRIRLNAVSEDSIGRELRFTGAIQAFKQGRIEIPRQFGKLTDQLARIVASPRSGGGFRFSVGREGGDHADLAMALLLALEPILRKENKARAFHRAMNSSSAQDRWLGIGSNGDDLDPWSGPLVDTSQLLKF